MIACEHTLIIEARDLDTDERTATTLSVSMPPDEAGQRQQLAAADARLHPEARMRSFGDGAASFLDSQRLVVAHYRRAATPRPAPEPPAEATEQQPLFAA